MTELEKRTKLLMAAYTYEMLYESIISDYEYDMLAKDINPEVETGNEVMDKFFKEEFDPSTGMWIYKYPELDKIKLLYKATYG